MLRGIVDYAGLFPPAGLAMAPTVRHYARHRAGDAAWMLGRLVVPVARLEEFEAAAGPLLPPPVDPEDAAAARAAAAAAPAHAPWPIAALLGDDVADDLARVRAFNARHAAGMPHGRAVIDVVEGRVADPQAVAALAGALGRAPGLAAFAELPAGADPAPFADAAARHGVGLKVRTGGVRADAFPSAAAVLGVLAACARRQVPCKATAGLHHPLAGEHPLGDEPGCPRARMFGFVGVFLAAALLRAGHPADALAPLLVEGDPGAFALDDGAIGWRGRAADAATLAATRAGGLVSFGSCSFEEPVGDLRALGWWPA